MLLLLPMFSCPLTRMLRSLPFNGEHSSCAIRVFFQTRTFLRWLRYNTVNQNSAKQDACRSKVWTPQLFGPDLEAFRPFPCAFRPFPCSACSLRCLRQARAGDRSSGVIRPGRIGMDGRAGMGGSSGVIRDGKTSLSGVIRDGKTSLSTTRNGSVSRSLVTNPAVAVMLT